MLFKAIIVYSLKSMLLRSRHLFYWKSMNLYLKSLLFLKSKSSPKLLVVELLSVPAPDVFAATLAFATAA